MKYIRTKDNIYTDDNLHTVTHASKDCIVQPGDKLLITDKGYVKVEDKDIANTIEELCDAWIIVLIRVTNCNPFVRHIHENISHFINDSHVIFAGIWTKGEHNEPILKSVAKMNEKGEFELL